MLLQRFLLTANEASVVPTYHRIVHLPFMLLANCGTKVCYADATPVWMDVMIFVYIWSSTHFR